MEDAYAVEGAALESRDVSSVIDSIEQMLARSSGSIPASPQARVVHTKLEKELEMSTSVTSKRAPNSAGRVLAWSGNY